MSGAIQYDLRDSYQTVTCNGKSMRVRSGNKLTIDPGAKASHMKGHRETPEDIARGTAEPKFTIDGLLERDISDIRAFINGIGGFDFNYTVVFKRPNSAVRRFKLTQCQVSGGLGLTGEDAGITDKLEALCLDIFEDRGNGYVSIFHKRYPA